MKLRKPLAQLLIVAGFLSLGITTAVYAQESSSKALELKTSADQLLRSGQVPTAILTYKEALALKPSFKEVHFNLAIAYFMSQNYEEAMTCLENLLALDPNDSEANYNLACLYLYQKNVSKARALFEKASSCCPKKADFEPLIQNTLGLLDRLEDLDPQAQDFVLTRVISNALYPVS